MASTHSDHNHEHDHPEGGHHHLDLNASGRQGLAFKIAFGLTIGFVLLEFIAGFWANSLALISDAGHNLSDALALAFSLGAIILARRAPNFNKTYGYHRAGILAATLNAVTLVLIAIYIFYEAAQRLANPPEVQGWTVIIVAAVALIINLSVAGLLHGWSKEDLNTRSAYIHVIGDAAASVGVIIAGIIEVVTGWKLADPLISILIGGLILWSSWGIIKEATNVLLEGVPAGLDMVSLLRSLMSQPSVTDVHDLHVWTIGSGFRALSCHIKVDEDKGYSLHQANQTVQSINLMLEEDFNIHHATVQIECDNCNFNETFCAGPAVTETNQQSQAHSLSGKE